MHILATTSASLDDLVEPVDLGQKPADMIALSFADSDLMSIARAWSPEQNLPSLRLASLADLKHPMSVDLWIDSVAKHAKVILVRFLGGYDWWSYGCERLAELARTRNIALALLPGESHESDPRLEAASTLPADELKLLLDFFRQGGSSNMALLLRRLAHHAGNVTDSATAISLPLTGYYLPGRGVIGPEDVNNISGRNVPILFYRSMLLAGDTEPVDVLFEALTERGINPIPLFVPNLKDRAATAFVAEASMAFNATAIICATAFASGKEPDDSKLFDRIGIPVFQAIIATTRRQAWQENQRGLAPADLAMHVVLPELDGRILAGAVSFKLAPDDPDLFGLRLRRNAAEINRIDLVADRVAAYLRLRETPVSHRRLMIMLPDYPGALGRTGYAVGLDVPASVIALLRDLKDAGYEIGEIPGEPRDLIALLARESETFEVSTYRTLLEKISDQARKSLISAWGPVSGDLFKFRACRFGNITVGLAPDRGRFESRRADYHDPVLPPDHALVAFGFWLRHELDCHALVHMGAHGTLEWLPGKNVALTQDCFPEIVTGSLPVIYPFIVSNPGEAAQAKRRIAAVTIGHLPPPLIGAGANPLHRDLELLVDEYTQADGLDRRRRDRLARLIVETAKENGLAVEAGVSEIDDPETALLRIDSWLCDLKDFAIKDGLHVYGRESDNDSHSVRRESASAEKAALLAALDGRHVKAGPSGSPARGRTDVLPTGRNIYTSDPRSMPTPTAYELGQAGAEMVLRRFVQEHGDWPKSLIVDLWGSASLRTGGEEIAQGLAMLGCRPVWDHATGRVTGIEVLPPASIGRPRIDVTWRISGLFRDMFPTQIALMDAAIRAVSERNEADSENPLAAEFRNTGVTPGRIFGSAPGVYGAGIEEKLQCENWDSREELGRTYLETASHLYGGTEGDGKRAAGAYAGRVASAELLLHTADDPARDILEGSADVAFIGGFAAALAELGKKAELITLDTTDPANPRARTLRETITRAVRARATNPKFIEGQMRHGPRGASEFAETVDRLIGFAETTDAVPGALIEAVHDAYVGDRQVREFMLRENPEAARAIAQRFSTARRRGLWHPRRNSVDEDLASLIAEARALEIAS